MFFDFKAMTKLVAIACLAVSAIGFFTTNYNLSWGFGCLAGISLLVGQFRNKP
jgi:hypothetical protein